MRRRCGSLNSSWSRCALGPWQSKLTRFRAGSHLLADLLQLSQLLCGQDRPKELGIQRLTGEIRLTHQLREHIDNVKSSCDLRLLGIMVAASIEDRVMLLIHWEKALHGVMKSNPLGMVAEKLDEGCELRRAGAVIERLVKLTVENGAALVVGTAIQLVHSAGHHSKRVIGDVGRAETSGQPFQMHAQCSDFLKQMKVSIDDHRSAVRFVVQKPFDDEPQHGLANRRPTNAERLSQALLIHMLSGW